MNSRLAGARHLACAVLVACLCVQGGSAAAAPIAVANPSFEAQSLGDLGFISNDLAAWTLTGSATAGPFNPMDAQFPGATDQVPDLDTTIPDGKNVAYSSGKTISQVLGAVLAGNTLYTLKVEVGDRLDLGFPGYAVELLAGGTTLAAESSLTPANGTFAASMVQCLVPADSPLLGQPLAIRLRSNGNQTDFDDVRLDATPTRPTYSVPIANPSFEAQVLSDPGHIANNLTGWTLSGPADGGPYNPADGSYPGATDQTPDLDTTIPDGRNVAYSNGRTLSQVLTSTLRADTQYTLQVHVGNRLEASVGFPGYTVQLLANGEVVAEDSALTPSKGTFSTSVLQYTAPAGSPLLGRQLEVRLLSSGSQTNFDDVRLLRTYQGIGRSLEIANHGFEEEILAVEPSSKPSIIGWTVTGAAGTWNPTNVSYDGASGGYPDSDTTIPEGRNVAYSNGGSISQVLGDVLVSGLRYVLQVEVGDRKDTAFPGYAVELLAGGVVVASESSLVPSSGFLTSMIDFTADPGDPALSGLFGQPLQIRLRGNGTQVNFDDVRLFAIPEPATLTLLALGTLGLLARRRHKH